MKYIAILTLVVGIPSIALAQENILSMSERVINFLNNTIVPFFFTIALLVFIFNVVRFFIVNIANSQAKETARRYILYSVIGMVLMTSIWGITNLLVDGTGLGQSTPICPDFFEGDCDGFDE